MIQLYIYTCITRQRPANQEINEDQFKQRPTNQASYGFTCRTKSRPLKSAMVRGSRVRPQTKRRKRERSALLNSSITLQNHWTSGAPTSTPLYVATDLSKLRGMSGLPHTYEM